MGSSWRGQRAELCIENNHGEKMCADRWKRKKRSDALFTVKRFR